jgi:hypothetical protein
MFLLHPDQAGRLRRTFFALSVVADRADCRCVSLNNVGPRRQVSRASRTMASFIAVPISPSLTPMLAAATIKLNREDNRAPAWSVERKSIPWILKRRLGRTFTAKAAASS